MAAEKLVHLDPAKVLAEDNIRYQLLPHRVSAMADSILARGGVQTPVEVAKLDPVVNGFTHKLTAGFYRHAAALKLNTESAAGLTLPAIVRQPASEEDRVLRQVSENRDRENLSPMDEAVAIKKLLDMGVSKTQVCALFARPGGQKGTELKPASNAHVNMMLSFLELPKAIQTKIHDGRVGVKAGYELTKVPAEQRDEILAKAEANRLKEVAREEKADQQEATAAEREAAKTAKLDAAKAAHEAALTERQDAETARTAAVEARKLAAKIGPFEEQFGAGFAEWTAEQKEKFSGGITTAKAAEREADKRLGAAIKGLDKAQRAYRALTDAPKAEAEGAPLPGDPEPVKAKAKTRTGQAGKVSKAAVGQDDVRKAAAEAGVAGKHVALNATQARAAAADLAKSKFAKVKAIGQVFAKLLSGELAPKSAETDLSVITGERAVKKA